ncbi:MAG: methyltransferase domain-containing protein [Polyangiaceae bacterium]|nr:methyltransferase domain-containing protein [Polyangiaceae bacterium]
MSKLELGGVRWWVVLLMGLAAWLAFALAMRRIHVEGDIFAALPSSSPTLESSRRLLRENSLTEQIGVDVSFTEPRPLEALILTADEVARAMRESGLFASVGMESAAAGLMELNGLIAEHLPLLFSTTDLEGEVAEAFTPAAVRASLAARMEELAALEGTGRSEFVRRDPLDLRFLVLRRLQGLTVGLRGRVEQGHLVSADGRHVLIAATPLRSISDGEHNQKLAAFFADLAPRLQAPTPTRPAVHLDVVGGFRSALDNEAIVRADTNRAILLSGFGIALLLVLFFSRPVLGALSLLPATTGVALGLLELSFIDRDVSALSLGFGGALVSIAVDQGIMFASFLDRFRDRPGAKVAAAIFSPGLLATLTTAGAFLALRLSGFELLSELGTFAALSVISSFVVVQAVFPWVFRPLAPSPSRPLLPLDRVLGAVCIGRGLRVAVVAVGLVAALALLARPRFEVDLSAMSTVSPATAAAEQNVKATWGDVLSNVYVYFDARDETEIRRRSDALAGILEEEARVGGIGSWFSPSRVAPGPELAARNAHDWARYFSAPRRAAVVRAVTEASRELGFAEDAFAPFLDSLSQPPAPSMPLPPALLPVVGVSRRADGRFGLLVPLERGPAYQVDRLSERIAGAGGLLHDGRYLAEVLGGFLRSAFLRMVALIGGFVLLCVIVTFVDPLLIAMVMAPVGFGLAATLGVLGAIGRPLDIAGLLLAIIVFGMGVDFSLHLVRSYQRCPRDDDPEHMPVRAATFLECTATVIGMASLAFAQHSQAKSAGIVGLIGISTCGIGAFVLLPPLGRRLFASLHPLWRANPARPARATFRRYRYLPASYRGFAWCKLRLDPMFARLCAMVGTPRRILDVGCGLAVPATYLLASHDEASVVATEPDPERARIARLTLGSRGAVHELQAPALPEGEGGFDLALMLDVAHYLDDETLDATLTGIRGRLGPEAVLVIRETIPHQARPSLLRRIEAWRLAWRRITPRFRSAEVLAAALERAGFVPTVDLVPEREEAYLLARPLVAGGAA